MTEFYNAAFSYINLPFTILLFIITIYWLIFIFIGFEFNIEIDFLSSFFETFQLADVPITFFISIFVFFLWSNSMLMNYYINNSSSITFSLLLLIPNLIISSFITGIIARLIYKFIKTSDEQETQKIMFKIGNVITSVINNDFGQVEIPTNAAPIIINARTNSEKQIVKGDKVIVYDEDKEKSIYFVEKYNE